MFHFGKTQEREKKIAALKVNGKSDLIWNNASSSGKAPASHCQPNNGEGDQSTFPQERELDNLAEKGKVNLQSEILMMS